MRHLSFWRGATVLILWAGVCCLAAPDGGGAAAAPACEQHLLEAAPAGVLRLSGSCAWKVPSTVQALAAALLSSNITVSGSAGPAGGTNHTEGQQQRQPGPPAITCVDPGTPGGSTAVAAAAGIRLHLTYVVLVNCRLPPPPAQPVGLLPARRSTSGGRSEGGGTLWLRDVRVLVDGPTLQQHLAFFKDLVNQGWAATDGATFLHVNWWAAGDTTWQGVGLLVADSLEQAVATGVPHNSSSTLQQQLALISSRSRGLLIAQGPPSAHTVAPGSGASRAGALSSMSGRKMLAAAAPAGVGAPGTPPPGTVGSNADEEAQRNYVLWADNSTIVQHLRQKGGIHTPVPLLLYLTDNVTLGAAQVLPSGVAINRPLYWVGLSSANTSVDFHMSVNQLVLTGTWSNITFNSLVIENTAAGDAKSAEVAAPLSTTSVANIWAVYTNRSESRLNVVNVTQVLPIPSAMDSLLWGSTIWQSKLPRFQEQKAYYRNNLGASRFQSEVVEPGVALRSVHAFSNSGYALDTTFTIRPVVAPLLPLPPQAPGLGVPRDPTTTAPLIEIANSSAQLLTAVQRPPSSAVPRDHIILLLVNLTAPVTSPPPVMVPCHTQFVGVDAQTNSSADVRLPDVWLDFAHQVHAWQVSVDAKPQDDFGISNLNSSRDPGTGGCLAFRRCILTGLPQGRAAGRATDMRTPDLWTLLLWPLRREWRPSGPAAVLLEDVVMSLPAAEFDWLACQAASSSTVVLPLSGGNDMVLTGVAAVGTTELLLGSLRGAGLVGTNLTLLKEASSNSSCDGSGSADINKTHSQAAAACQQQVAYTWPAGGSCTALAAWSGPSQGSSKLSRGALAGLSVAAAVVACLLIAAAVLVSRRVRQRRKHGPSGLGFGKDVLPPACRQSRSSTSSGMASETRSGHAATLDVIPHKDVEARSEGHSSKSAAAGVPGTPQGPVPSNGAGVPVTPTASSSAGTSSAAGSSSRSASDAEAMGAARLHTAVSSLTRVMQQRRLQAHLARQRTGGADPGSMQQVDAGGRGVVVEACTGVATGGQSQVGSDDVALHGVLGRGSFATVYSGTWRGRLVAVKLLHLPSLEALQQLGLKGGGSSGQQAPSHTPDDNQDVIRGHNDAAPCGGASCGPGRLSRMAVMEAAISSSMRHPNIVQVFNYSLHALGQSGQVSTSSNMSSAQLGGAESAPVADSGSQVLPPLGWELRLVMEYCDRGTLREALDSGALVAPATRTTNSHRAAGAGMAPTHPWPQLGLVLPLVIDVASALLHIHSEGLLHGDLKARNVMLATGSPQLLGSGADASLLADPGLERLPRQLLRQLEAAARAAAATPRPGGGASSERRGCGLVGKLADFGLSLSLGTEATHISHIHGGTLSHMSPELLLAGRASRASDVYAMGVLLWEALTGARPWAGMPAASLPTAVVLQHARPAWPPGWQAALPGPLVELVEAAWAQEPAARPDAAHLLYGLQHIYQQHLMSTLQQPVAGQQ